MHFYNLTFDFHHEFLRYTLCQLLLNGELWLMQTFKSRRGTHEVSKSVWAAATLRQSELIFLMRTVTFEAISSGVAHKEWHGGKINHCLNPQTPYSSRLAPTPLCSLLSGPCGHQRAAKAHQWELENPPRSCSGVSSASPRHKQLPSQSGSSLTVSPHTFAHCPSLHALSVTPNSRRFQ